jgi:hypothetical protein
LSGLTDWQLPRADGARRYPLRVFSEAIQRSSVVGPRFPLPKELQSRGFRFHISHAFIEEEENAEGLIERITEGSKRIE